MLLKLYDEVGHAASRADLLAGLLRFAEHLDFGRAAILFGVVGPSGGNEITALANVPEGYEQAFNSLDDQVRDPVMQKLREINRPILWDRDTYFQAGASDLWDIQAPFGYKTGVAVSVHLPYGSYVMFGIERDAHLPKRDATKARLLADVQLMVVHAQQAAVRLLQGPGLAGLLTEREAEVLRWLAADKSTSVIAQLIGISENTVDFHLKNLYRKLKCSSRQSAVVTALRLGLLPTTP